MTHSTILEGHIAVRAVIESDSRPIYTLYIQKNKTKQYRNIIKLAEEKSIPLALVNEADITGVADGQSHGGIIAVVGERNYVTLDKLAQHAKIPFVAMLDGIEDPYNFGQAIRALYAAGAHGLVVRERNWLSATGVVTRSSAGTSERMAIAQVEHPLDAIQHFKKRGLRIVCTANHEEAETLYDANLQEPIFVFIGGEKRGTSKRILKEADMLLRIPYARQFAYSLGATAAASVIAYEVARQRGLS